MKTSHFLDNRKIYDEFLFNEIAQELADCTIKVCRFEIVDGVKYVYCIKQAYIFLLREQEGFAAVL